MPFIRITLSKQITKGQATEAKKELGKLITLLKGKDESKLMLDFCWSPFMFFHGDDLTNGAYVDCRLFGPMPEEDKKNFSEAVFKAFKDVLGIEPADMFMSFSHFSDWASSGTYKMR